MDWSHVAMFLAPYLPTVANWLKSIFQQWLDAKYPKQSGVSYAEIDGLEDRSQERLDRAT